MIRLCTDRSRYKTVASWLVLLSTILSVASFAVIPTAAQRKLVGFLHESAAKSFESTSSDNEVEDSSSNEATIRSITFRNISKSQNPDLFCDLLMELGACSTAISDANANTPDETPLYGEPSLDFDPWRQTNTDPSSTWAPVPLWTQCTVTAHFTAGVDLEHVLQIVKDTNLFSGVSHDEYDTPQESPSDRRDELSSSRKFAPWLEDPEVTVLPNQDWVIKVQENWKPIVVANRIVLKFPWHTQKDVLEQLQLGDEANDQLVELELQGGVAFGTGEHATTQLCLEWLDEAVTQLIATLPNEEGIDVLDYGAGSGVLGMAACAMAKDRVRAIGIEIDYDSCMIANANARNNQVNMRNYLPPLTVTNDSDSLALLLKAHAHARRRMQERSNDLNPEDDDAYNVFLPESLMEQKYDITVANILAGPLVTLAPTLANLTKPGGRFGLSGVLPNQGEMIVEAYRQAGFENVKVAKHFNGWLLVTGNKA